MVSFTTDAMESWTLPAIVNAVLTSCLKCAYKTPVINVEATAVRTVMAMRDACHCSVNWMPLEEDAVRHSMKSKRCLNNSG